MWVRACRAAADDLNTARGGDLKLTVFGPRLPLLLRDALLGCLGARLVRGALVHNVAISMFASPSGDANLKHSMRPIRAAISTRTEV